MLQAKINANALKDKGIQHIYSSPLKRAYKTGFRHACLRFKTQKR